MSKHHKHRGLAMDASSTTSPSGQTQPPSSIAAAGNSPVRRIAWQLVGVLGASVVLGFAFNTSSPVGIRFNDESSESQSSPSLITQPSVPPAVANRSAPLPPAPLLPVEKPAVRPEVVSALPLAPTPLPMPNQVSTRQLPPASPVTPPVPALPPTTSSTEQNPAPIHWTQAKPLVEAGQAALVDVRHKAMFDAGHIPGAISLPETSSPEEFTVFLNQHPANLTLIVYCSSVSCSQSARVANRLVTQFQRPSVKYMTGGYMEYQQAELAKNPAQTTP